jgi:hypothetical protein
MDDRDADASDFSRCEHGWNSRIDDLPTLECC